VSTDNPEATADGKMAVKKRFEGEKNGCSGDTTRSDSTVY
jgi:hypothetical protein